MNKKSLIAVLLGILVAALICIIVGIIIYFNAFGIQLDKNAADYSTLLQQKNSAMAMGSLIIIVGCSSFILPAVALIVIMIVNAVSAAKHSKK
ncbi:MAG: hypothetical protein ACI4MH_03745 [Candidatus Coproplasma sp.]